MTKWIRRECCGKECKKTFFCQGNCKDSYINQHDFCCCPKCAKKTASTLVHNPDLCPRAFTAKEPKEVVLFT